MGQLEKVGEKQRERGGREKDRQSLKEHETVCNSKTEEKKQKKNSLIHKLEDQRFLSQGCSHHYKHNCNLKRKCTLQANVNLPSENVPRRLNKSVNIGVCSCVLTSAFVLRLFGLRRGYM